MKQETCTPKKQCLGLRTLTIFWVANSNIAKNARCGTSLEQSHSSTRQRARREPGHGCVWTSADPTGVVTAVSTGFRTAATAERPREISWLTYSTHPVRRSLTTSRSPSSSPDAREPGEACITRTSSDGTSSSPVCVPRASTSWTPSQIREGDRAAGNRREDLARLSLRGVERRISAPPAAKAAG